MGTISLLSAILLFIVFFAVGMFVQQYLTNRKIKNKTDWKSKYEEANAEYKNLSKRIKKDDKALTLARNDRDDWKNKFETLEGKNQSSILAHREALDALQANLEAAQKETRDINILKSHADKDAAKWKKEFEKLKEKYAEDVGDIKSIRNERDKRETVILKLNKKATQYEKENKELKAQIEKDAETMSNIRSIKRDLRKANTQISKLQKDLQYWEQKHYDTHHELAALKETHAQLQAKAKELNDLRNGDQIVMTNMKKQIEVFKARFLDVDRKYKELIS